MIDASGWWESRGIQDTTNVETAFCGKEQTLELASNDAIVRRDGLREGCSKIFGRYRVVVCIVLLLVGFVKCERIVTGGLFVKVQKSTRNREIEDEPLLVRLLANRTLAYSAGTEPRDIEIL
jgi:hypothetical protein